MSDNLIAVIIGLCFTIIGALLVANVVDIVKRKVEEVTVKVDALKLWMLDQLTMIEGDYKSILNQYSQTIKVLEALVEDNAVTDNRMEKITDILDSMDTDLKRHGDILNSVSAENNMLVSEVRNWVRPAEVLYCDGDACDINFEEDNSDE